MIRVLFVCWGNICRSPMAEFVLKDMVAKRGISEEFYIESAATSTEEIGNGIYPPARAELARHGIGVAGNELGLNDKRARQLRRDDYDKWDFIIGMEQLNMGYMHRILGGDPEGKVRLLMDFTDTPEDIDDPWYTGDFGGVYEQIVRGCEALITEVGY
ncbi:MAG: low molecular weight phosphotyrosine protein phosphatase [Lachnospiraceae bacterium]|nr:low molecular weight phosphotyrosine protein phosphatase [Lachnospiraceae bacterium]